MAYPQHIAFLIMENAPCNLGVFENRFDYRRHVESIFTLGDDQMGIDARGATVAKRGIRSKDCFGVRPAITRVR